MTGVDGQILAGFGQGARPVWLTPQDRARHMHVIGASGMGKSFFLQSMIQQDIERGNGVCVIDPHGELYNNLLRYCATKPELRRRVVLFNPSEESEFIIGFNPLARTPYYPKVSVQVDRFIEVVKKVMLQEDAVQPQLESALRNTLLPIIKGGYSLLELEHFFNYREEEKLLYLAGRAEDQKVTTYWQTFLKERDKESRIGSLQRRAERFIYSETIRLLIGETERTLDLWDIIEGKKILLVNLGKEGNIISKENAQLLGVMLVNELTAYGVARNTESAKKRPFYVYIDEFQDYVTSDIHDLITGGRKFGMSLILAHQEQAQIEDEKIRNAVLAANTQVIFGGTSSATAEEMAENTTGLFHDLNRVKYWDERTQYKPVLRKETVRGYSDTDGESDSHSSATNENHGSKSGMNIDRNKHHTMTTNSQDSRSSGRSETNQRGHSNSHSQSVNETFVTDHEEVKEQSPRFWTLEEQNYLAKTALIKQGPREAVIQVGRQSAPARIRTPEVENPKADRKAVEDFKAILYRTHGCYSRAVNVARRIDLRSAQFNNLDIYDGGTIRGIAEDDGEEFPIKALRKRR